MKIQLIGGDTISGSVSSIKEGTVSMITEYGIVRIPLTKLSDASRKQLGIEAESSAGDLQKRVADLENLVQRLQDENAELKKRLGAGVSIPQPLVRSGGAGAAVQAQAKPQAGRVWISSTGKAHNSSCRYYGMGKGGYANPGSGVACKICGG